jgi:hypothetical protein
MAARRAPRVNAGIRRLALAAAVAFFAYVGYELYAAGLDERPPPPTTASLTFRDGRVVGHRIATRSWSADFDRIVSNADQTFLELDGVRNGTIYRAGKPYLHVSARHMAVNTISRDFTASGPIHVETIGAKPRRSFDTTSAAWSDSVQRLTLDKHIVVHNGTDAPLDVGSMTFEVRTGQIEVHDIDGPLRLDEPGSR